MGASLSSDVYQFKIDEIFEDISQCVGIADDIVIFAYDDHDHDQTLYTVLYTLYTVLNVHSRKIQLVFME